jgi:hypothetical protein
MKIFDKIIDKFKKKELPKPETKPAPKKVHPKEGSEPWVDVLNVKLDADNPSQGFFELDWNEPFVVMLRENGYEGSEDELIVDKWFSDLCKTIVREEIEDEFELLGEAPNIIQLKDGRKVIE